VLWHLRWHKLKQAAALQDQLGYSPDLLEKVDITEPIVPLPKAAMPPYNGYGTLDDSKQNCIALVPKPPKKVCAIPLSMQ
jgi:hypothetical protein